MTANGDDRLALDLLIRGFQISRTIRLAADLRLADRIAPEGSASLAELAAACEVRAQPLMRVLRLLAAFGIFRFDGEAASHTPRSLLLRSDAPGSLHHSARFWTTRGSWRAWEDLDAALAGKVPHEVAWGTSRFAYLREHPDEARLFDAFMANFTDDRHAAIAAAYDFSGARLVADIGGGNGETLRRILANHAEMRGLLFDRPDVIGAVAPEALAGGRIETQGGSFFEGVPAGADIYLLVRVLHDWPDDRAVAILRACRAAMAPGARLLAVEGLMNPDPAKAALRECLIDMQMMAMFGDARERTEAEFRALLTQAGFELTRTIATPSTVSILEAAPR